MEGLGTYDSLLKIAKLLADDYSNDDGCIESYAEWIVDWYKNTKVMNKNDYHNLLLNSYESTIRNLIVQRLQARA
jgi:hypothetical protein